jgi:TolB-like protein/DNA-binding winged helix-turn-helix (wHTH) protein/Flp pilus assembly protein TadD
VNWKEKFTVGEWTVEPQLDRISRGGQRVDLQPQVMDLLVFLAQHAGQVVSSAELMTNLWEGRVVTSSSVYVGVNQLREALGDDANTPRYIKTITKRGYRLVAKVRHPQSPVPDQGKITDRAVGFSWQWGASFLAILVVSLFVLLGNRESSQPDPDSAGATAAPSVAVLPFADLSPAQDQGWFADGVAEEILKRLAQIPDLKVSGRSSSFTFREPEADLRNIGQVLGVTHLLEGSVRKNGDMLRVTAQLVKANDGFNVWSESYDTSQDQIFEIHDDVAQGVAQALQAEVVGISTGVTTDPEAYALYLKGRFLENLDGRENRFKAFTAYQKALFRDPDYAPALVGIARQYTYRGPFYDLPREQQYALTMDALGNALAKDPNLAEAWSLLSWVRIKYEWNWDGAAEALEKAMQLAPNDSDILGAAATLAWCLGQVEKEILLREKKVEADPLKLSSWVGLGLMYIRINRPLKAQHALQRVREENPDYPGLSRNFGLVYLLQGEASKALVEFRKYPTRGQNALNIIQALLALDDEQAAQAVVAQYLETTAKNHPFWTAAMFARLGNNDLAFEWLDTAFQKHDRNLAMILSNPHLASLHSDPRYSKFLEKLGLREEWEGISIG